MSMSTDQEIILFWILFIGMAAVWSLVFGLPAFLLVFGSLFLLGFLFR